jgi:L-threonylcarbamoyladenylate synthase
VGEGFIAISIIETPKGAVRLSSPKTIEEFAQNLYYALRLGDKMKLQRIVVTPPDGQGIAEAIRDRLRKASN